jgi:L-lysine 6-transaminase
MQASNLPVPDDLPPAESPTAARYPMAASAALLGEMRGYVIADHFPFVLDVARGEGMWLATVDGERLFDWAGYYGSKWIGHNHPRLFEPDYLRLLSFAANNKLANPDFLTPECLAYYREIHGLTPACMRRPGVEVYVVNSGAEAIENMMKYLINLHDRDKGGGKGARRFIYFDQAFHGRTIFALNVTELSHAPVITKDFHGLVHGNIQIPFPAIDADDSAAANRARTAEALALVEKALRAHAGEIVGMIVEPLQGAGGHRMAEKEFFQGLSQLAHDHGVYLGLDEVQTAGGQTGEFFMADQLQLPHSPQAIATGKKFGNGVLYMLESMEDKGVLDSTWGGSLADMVRFCQELRIVREEGLVEAAVTTGDHLALRLHDLQQAFPGLVSNVRGIGLYQGFSLATPALKAAVIDSALETENLLLLGAGTTSIRLRPNLHVRREDVDLLAEMLNRVIGRVGSRHEVPVQP